MTKLTQLIHPHLIGMRSLRNRNGDSQMNGWLIGGWLADLVGMLAAVVIVAGILGWISKDMDA